jgi:hypothetical protein
MLNIHINLERRDGLPVDCPPRKGGSMIPVRGRQWSGIEQQWRITTNGYGLPDGYTLIERLGLRTELGPTRRREGEGGDDA